MKPSCEICGSCGAVAENILHGSAAGVPMAMQSEIGMHLDNSRRRRA